MNIHEDRPVLNKSSLNALDNGVNEFVDYVLSFYSKGEIYDIGATRTEVLHATFLRLTRESNIPFEGDSLDREKVRDIILELRANHKRAA